jgi:hypothetical protein
MYIKIYKKVKMQINALLNFFIILNLIKSLFVFNKKKLNKIFIKFNYIKLQNILEKKVTKFFSKFNKKKKKYLKIKYLVNKSYKYKIKKKIKIKMNLFFFNKYKKKRYIIFINYLVKILNLNLKFKNEFINYWMRYYIYILKRIYVSIVCIFRKYMNIIKKQYRIFYYLINLKKIKRDKALFFYIFFFNNNKYKFLTKYKTFSYYNNIKNLITKSFYKKNKFNVYFFRLKKYIYLNKLNYILKNFKNIIKIKFLFILKNFVFIIFLKLILFWINYYLNNKLIQNNISFKNNNYILDPLYNVFVFIKKIKFDKFLFLKYSYFFFNNFLIKKSSQIGKRIF